MTTARRERLAADRQAQEHLARGLALAERGALFAARAELLEVLRIVAQAQDIALEVDRHGRALAAGLRALEEADDFPADAMALEAELDVVGIAATHRTPVLHAPRDEAVLPLVARERYYRYAEQELALAGSRQRVASLSLHGLSKLHALMAEQPSAPLASSRPKALVLARAAVAVDPENFWAANDLAVMLSADGRREEARELLAGAAGVARHPAVWENLATLHERLGEHELAQRARAEAERLRAAGPPPAIYAGQPVGQGPKIEWVPPQAFAGPGPPGAATPAVGQSPAGQTPLGQPSAAPGVSSSPAWRPWRR